MPTIAALTTFTANTQAKAAEVNANFSTIRTTVNTYAAFVDTAATISGAWTFSTAPTFSNAQTFAAGVTITTGGVTVSAGGITVTGNSTITGTLGGLTGLTVASGGAAITGDSSVVGTFTATTFAGSGASLTDLPAANLTGTAAAINGSNITALNATNLASGTVNVARLPSDITGRNSVQAGSFSGTSGSTSALILDNSSGTMMTIPSGSGFRIGNNGSPNNWSITGPTGLATYNSGQNDLFVLVQSNGVDYHIRLERWTT